MSGNGTAYDDGMTGSPDVPDAPDVLGAAPELAALAAAREVPPPGPAVVAAALAALREAAGREAAGTGAAGAAQGTAVLPPAPSPVPVSVSAPDPVPVRTRTRIRRRWLIAAACVAGLTTVLAVLPTVGADGPPPASANAASTFLGSVATHVRGSSVGADASLLTTVRERRPGFPETEFAVSIGHGQGVIRPAQGHGHGPEATPEFPYGPFLAPSFSWQEVATLPSGTTELRDRLRALAPDQDLFGVIGGLLSISPVTPQVRAALYRVLATVPGVSLLGTGKDARGRSGTWVAHDGGTMRWKLLVDPDTGRLLQQDQVTLKAVPAASCAKDRTPPVCPPALAAGDLVSRMTFLTQRVTG